MRKLKFTSSYREWIYNGFYKKAFLLGGMIIAIGCFKIDKVIAAQISLNQPSSMDVVQVSLDGTKDCRTIAEAVYLVKEEGTVIIFPGTYKENIRIRDKNISLQGIDKETCIIQSEEGLYQKAPLDMGCGTVSNLTIYNKAPESKDISGDVQAYAIHCDDQSAKGKYLSMNHCKLISDLNYVLGIGGRDDLVIDLYDCELISNNAGAIFYHDAPIQTLAGKIQFQMRQCKIENNSVQPTFVMLSLCEYNKTHFCFQYNQVIEDDKVIFPIMTKDWQSGSEWFQSYQNVAEYGPEVEAFLKIIDNYYNPPVEETEEDTEEPQSTEQEIQEAEQAIEEEQEEPALNKWYGISSFYLDENSIGNSLAAMNYMTAYVTY